MTEMTESVVVDVEVVFGHDPEGARELLSAGQQAPLAPSRPVANRSRYVVAHSSQHSRPTFRRDERRGSIDVALRNE